MSNAELLDQISVIFAAGVFVLFILFVFPFFLYQRSKVAKYAGRLLLRVARPRVRRATLVFFAVWWATVAGQWVTLWLIWSPTVTTDYARIATAVTHTLFALAALTAYWFGATNAYFEVREEGIVHYGTGFWPWDQLNHYAWKDGANPTLQLQFKHYSMQCRIAGSQRDMVDGLLEKHLPADESQEGLRVEG